MSIELVIQAPSGRIPVQADPKTSLSDILSSIDESSNASSLRYLQTTVHRSQWDTMTLHNLGLKSGARALLILEMSGSMDTNSNVNRSTASDNASTLEPALSKILQSNFDQDSQTCIVTLMKVIDNVIQKPNNPKVRSIRLANPTVAEKIVARGGGKIMLNECL
jgi:transglutaminase/protease-like cytokinesis protein 3